MDIFWDQEEINEAIKFLQASMADGSSTAVGEKIEEIKKQCKEEYGLEHTQDEFVKIEHFMRWMRKGLATYKNVRMKYYAPDFRGVHACESIAEHEIFLNVPRNLIITPQSGKDTPIGQKLLASGVKITWDYLVYIAVFLLTEMKKPDSTWKPFTDMYPRLVNGFPLFYSEEEKKLLKGTPMIDQIHSETEQMKEEYKRIVTAVPEFSMFTEDEYIKNKVLVISRIFFVKIKGVTERIMVPLAGTLFKM